MASIFFTERLPGTSNIESCTAWPTSRCRARRIGWSDDRITERVHHAAQEQIPQTGTVEPAAFIEGEPDGSSGFLKSRVHAKFIGRRILKRYQIIIALVA
jgi:hypothetical protein